MDNELLVKSIRETCKENNITPSQLENELGFGAGLISRWSKSSPSLDKIIDIADYFKISIDELIGRKIDSTFLEEDSFLFTLMKFTKDKSLIWNIDKNYLIKEICNQSYEDIFGIYKDDTEIYNTSFNESTIFLVSQYDIYYGKMDDIDIALYIRPDNNSIPVLQNYSSESLEDIWYEIRKGYKGIPDELKAEKIKSQIVNKGRDIILKNIDNNILESMNTPELRKLISIFSDPKMIETMNSAQKIVNYINDVNNKNFNKDK
mgnify:CR=1 FL=1